MIQKSRFRNLIFSVVVVFAIFNVLLTFRLLRNNDCLLIKVENGGSLVQKIPSQPYAIIAEATNISDQPAFSNLNVDVGRWDSTRLYKHFDFAVTGERFKDLSEEYVVCLATQSSLEKLYSLVQVAHHFSGPISVAVFASGNEEFSMLQWYVTYLRKCYPAIRDSVSFHLAIPKDGPDTNLRVELNEQMAQFNCSQPKETLNEIMKYRSVDVKLWRTENPYPQNHLRNLARKGCQNDFVFLTDVDIIPSKSFAKNLDKFLRTSEGRSDKCAFVIPTYEIDDSVTFPKDKLELVRLAKQGLARPFHRQFFDTNQRATNCKKWESYLDKTEDTHISYNVTNFEFMYEPFYVSSDLVPAHDERFVGYGFTRNTQIYETFVAGYQFQVLSPIFVCHWGLQTLKTHTDWRERQQKENRKSLEQFHKEVVVKYNRDPLKMVKRG